MLYCRRAVENYEFKYRQNKNKLHFLAYWAQHEMSVDCAKIKQFQFKGPSTDKEPSIFTLMEMKPVLMEKREFDLKDVSNLL